MLSCELKEKGVADAPLLDPLVSERLSQSGTISAQDSELPPAGAQRLILRLDFRATLAQVCDQLQDGECFLD